MLKEKIIKMGINRRQYKKNNAHTQSISKLHKVNKKEAYNYMDAIFRREYNLSHSNR